MGKGPFPWTESHADRISQVYRDRLLIDPGGRGAGGFTPLQGTPAIERHQSNRLNSTYLLSTNGLYNAYPALESLISPFRDGVNSGNLRLSERYWLRNKRPPIGFPKEDAPLKIAIHLRRGDRTLIRTAQSLISVFADTAQKIRLEEQINSSENLELQNTQLVSIIDQLNAHLETENCTIFVLTDGTNRTFYCVLKKLLSGGLRLPIREAVAVFKKLYVLSTFLEKNLRLHSNVHLITGESRRTLFQSIHALVIADVVILTSGGFAYWIHTFLKPLGKASVIVKLDDFLNQPLSSSKKSAIADPVGCIPHNIS